MALIQIKSEDDVLIGIFDITTPVVMTDVSTSKTKALLVTPADGAGGSLVNVEFEIATGPAAFTAAQFSTEVENMLNNAIIAGVADQYAIPTVSNIIRLYDDTGAYVPDPYLAPNTITPIKAFVAIA